MEKVGTSNQDRTISLKVAVRSCINKQTGVRNVMVNSEELNGTTEFPTL